MYATAPPPGGVRPPTSSVELSLSAKSLKDRDIISKSDPFAVLYVKSGSGWTKLGKTEAKKDDLNPTWAKLFLVEYHFESVQQLKVEVYDQDSSSPDKLKDQDFIGGAEFTLGQLMGAPARAEEAKASSEAVRFRFSATSLANMDGMFSKSDPFLVISRLREDGQSWTQVHRTETIDNNLNPNWRVFELPMQQLCNGDPKRPLSLQVFDEDRGGKSDLIGHVQTTFEEIQGKRGTNFVLHNEALQKKKGKKYTNAGLLVATEVEIFRDHTFIDYLRGGLEMNLIIGIDYTASNGPPNDPRSLHLSILEGRTSTNTQYLQRFQFCKTLHGIAWAYSPPWTNFFRSVRHNFVSRKCIFVAVLTLWFVFVCKIGRLINQSMRIANQLSDPRKQKYFVLLIITDCDHWCRSADFSSMVALDGDGGKLRASNGRVSARDIVQFVPYNRFVGYPDALTRETLAEIPRQLCQYMKVRRVTPNPALPPTYHLFSEPTGSQPSAPPSTSQPPPAANSQPQQPPQGQIPPQGYAQAPPQGQQQGGYQPQPGQPGQAAPHGYQQGGYQPQPGQPGQPGQAPPQGYQQGHQQQPGHPGQALPHGYQQEGHQPQPGYPAQGQPQGYQQGYQPQPGYPGQGPPQGYQQGGYPAQPGYPRQGPPHGAAPGYPGYRG
ncbi:Copine [Phytophthora cactorum]|nr:Copine [Phytophthora cactorum]